MLGHDFLIKCFPVGGQLFFTPIQQLKNINKFVAGMSSKALSPEANVCNYRGNTEPYNLYLTVFSLPLLLVHDL